MPSSDAVENRRGLLAWFMIILAAVLIVLIGWFRERYILNFFLSDAPFLIFREEPNLQTYPLEIGSFVQQFLRDPRWFTTILLNGGMMFCSALIVWTWFGKKAYFWLVIGAYVFLSALCGFLVGLSLLLHDYSVGYGIAQELKDLLQLPFLLILFIPVLRLYEKQNPA